MHPKEAVSLVSLRLQASVPSISLFSRLKASVASRVLPRLSHSEGAYLDSQQQHRVLVEVDFSDSNSPNLSRAPFSHLQMRSHNSSQEVVYLVILFLNNPDRVPRLFKQARYKVAYLDHRVRLNLALSHSSNNSALACSASKVKRLQALLQAYSSTISKSLQDQASLVQALVGR